MWWWVLGLSEAVADKGLIDGDYEMETMRWRL